MSPINVRAGKEREEKFKQLQKGSSLRIVAIERDSFKCGPGWCLANTIKSGVTNKGTWSSPHYFHVATDGFTN